MARIFISHNSQDAKQAAALKRWLTDNGWDDTFLGIDSKDGLNPEELWKGTLSKAAGRCETVLCLVSPAWLGSHECLAEFRFAQYLKKHLIPVLIEPCDKSKLGMLSEVQHFLLFGDGTQTTIRFDFHGQPTECAFLSDGLGCLKNSLRKAGIGAEYFPWPPDNEPDRAPYRGLKPLEAADAAVFFGRDAQIFEDMCGSHEIGQAAIFQEMIDTVLQEPYRLPVIPADLNEQYQGLRRVFISFLVRINPENNKPMRQLAKLADIPADLHPLVERLVIARLLTSSAPLLASKDCIIGVTHESLLRQWTALRGWIEEERDNLRLQENIKNAAMEWKNKSEKKDFLLHLGGRLEDANKLVKASGYEVAAGSDEWAYLNACRAEQDGQEATQKAAQERRIRDAERIAEQQTKAAKSAEEANERSWKQTRLFRWIASVAGIFFFVAIGFAYYANTQRKEAQLSLSQQAESLGRYASSPLNEHKDSEALIRTIPAGKILQSQNTTTPGGLNTLAKGREYNRLEKHRGYVASVSISPDGKTLASGSYDTTIKLWNLQTGKEIHTLKGYNGIVCSVSFSPDGKTLASGSYDGIIKLWHVETGNEISLLKVVTENSTPVVSVSFSPDGKTLASGIINGTIKLWNIETGKEVFTLTGHTDPVLSVSFSPDSKILASGSGDDEKNSSDNTIRLWSLETGREIPSHMEHDKAVMSVNFSQDGKTLASGSGDNTIKLWNLQTGTLINTLTGHTNIVNSVNFSPDGKTLASGSGDSTIKLWDVGTGEEIRTFIGHDKAVNSVSFNPYGKTLVSGSDDATIKIWHLSNLDLDSSLRRSCNGVRGYLENNPKIKEEDKHLCEAINKLNPESVAPNSSATSVQTPEEHQPEPMNTDGAAATIPVPAPSAVSMPAASEKTGLPTVPVTPPGEATNNQPEPATTPPSTDHAKNPLASNPTKQLKPVAGSDGADKIPKRPTAISQRKKQSSTTVPQKKSLATSNKKKRNGKRKASHSPRPSPLNQWSIIKHD
jgi:WD40 repeat protein